MATDSSPLRGQVFFARFPHLGEKPVLVVSNNIRNQKLNDVLVVRITTATKPPIPTVVPLPDGEPVVGNVLCDSLMTVAKAELTRRAGGMSRRTMQRVDEGLLEALALRR